LKRRSSKALRALSRFSASYKAEVDFAILAARLEAAPFQN